MDITRTGNKSVLPEIRPMDDHQARKPKRDFEALRAVLRREISPALPDQQGSDAARGNAHGNADMTCQSCMFLECTGRTEGVWCEMGVYPMFRKTPSFRSEI